MTREIRTAAEALGITIHDHLVIGRKRHWPSSNPEDEGSGIVGPANELPALISL
jgi:hypothetical protein